MQVQSSGFLQQTSQIARNSSGLQKIFEKLSTGKAINRAADNPASLAAAKELEKQVRAFKQSDSNIGDAMNALKIADGAGSGITDMLQRQRELALQAQNGTLNQQDRDALNAEYKQISEEVARQTKSSQFNGQSVADGSSPLSNGQGQIQAGSGSKDQIGINKIDFSSASNVGDISNPANASNALKSLDSQIKNVISTRANIGAQTNTLEFHQRNLDNQAINTTRALSGIEDLDFAQGMMEKSRLDVLNQSAIRSQQSFGEMSKNNVQALLS